MTTSPGSSAISPQPLSAALEEILRIDDPFISNRRRATRETEVAGQRIAAGERVYLNWTAANRDPRAQEAINLLHHKQLADGTWPVQNRYSGKVFFNMEHLSKPSRWNTLRSLRILRWWQG